MRGVALAIRGEGETGLHVEKLRYKGLGEYVDPIDFYM